MKIVFVSHANADQALIDEFVDLILRNGCGLEPSEIFYSSGADTGVPDGEDLLAYVRGQVSEVGLTVALLTPTFQTRPVCLAELGAAWARTGTLFPLLVPEMKRGELEGVLSSQLVEYMNDDGPLDRLHSKITDATGRAIGAPTWTRAKLRWKTRLAELVASGGIATPRTVSVAEHEKLTVEHRELVGALAAAEEEIDSLKLQLRAVSALKDAAEVAEVTLPAASVERFETLIRDAKSHLRALDRFVARAIVAEQSSLGGLPFPSDDQWEQQQILDLESRKLLVADSEGGYTASRDFRANNLARIAVERAIDSVSDEDEEFAEWFDETYEARPNLESLEILDRIFFA